MSLDGGENDALHGAALSGVEEYDGTECADPIAGEYGDCGMRSRRGARADLGAGFANGEGGMITRGDSGRVLAVLVEPVELTFEAALWVDEVVVVEAFESYEVLRDRAG